LLTAGKAVFERDGFLEARIADIAADAGIAQGSFYHYFTSKEEIFREIAEDAEVRLTAVDELEEASPHSDPFGRIRDANRFFLAAYKREAKIMRVIEEVSRYDAEVQSFRNRRDTGYVGRLEKAIARLQDEGAADKRLDPAIAALALSGMVHRFAEQLFINGHKFDLDTAVEQLSVLWANALGMDSSVATGSGARATTKTRARRTTR
jgi:AcrR family transcriptional regulator